MDLGAAGLSSPQTHFSTFRVEEVVAKPTWKKPSCEFPSREMASRMEDIRKGQYEAPDTVLPREGEVQRRRHCTQAKRQ